MNLRDMLYVKDMSFESNNLQGRLSILAPRAKSVCLLLALLLPAMFLATLPVQADTVLGATYYLATNGNDAWTGTAPAFVSGATGPWLTFTHVTYGAKPGLQPGDVLYVRGGVWNHTNDSLGTCLRLYNLTGTSNSPIVVSNYPGETPLIFGSGPNNNTIDMRNSSWVKVFGINSTNAYRTPILQYCTNCELANCSFGGGDPTRGSICVFTMYNQCQSNWIHNNVMGPSTPFNNGADGGCHGATVGLFYSAKDFTSQNIIESNIFFHSGHDVLSVYGPSNVIQFNWGHSAPWYAFTNVLWGSRDLELGGTIGNYNLVQYNNWNYAGYVPNEGCKGVEMSDGAYEIFRYNYCLNNGSDGICIYGGKVGGTISCSNYIYNNTLAFNGFNSTCTTNGTPANISYPVWQNVMAFANTSNNFVVNNLAYHNFSTASTFFQGFSVNISRWANNLTNIDPLFINTNNTSGEFDLTLPNCTLQPGSPAIDAGTWLTTITSASGSGTSFTVADAHYFFAGLTAASRTIPGDTIQLQGQANPATITAISGNTITVATPLTWTTGQGLALAYGGTAPDVGAYEYYALAPPTNLRIAAPNP
jgi:hypothetical protein